MGFALGLYTRVRTSNYLLLKFYHNLSNSSLQSNANISIFYYLSTRISSSVEKYNIKIKSPYEFCLRRLVKILVDVWSQKTIFCFIYDKWLLEDLKIIIHHNSQVINYFSFLFILRIQINLWLSTKFFFFFKKKLENFNE